MWSFYHDKKHQIWLWWAVEHETNIPLAYTFGTREHKYLDKLLDLLKPFPIRTVYADNNFAYEKAAEQCLDKLRKVTRITGAIDWCQGDTKGIGVFAQTYDIMPFAQGMALRAMNIKTN